MWRAAEAPTRGLATTGLLISLCAYERLSAAEYIVLIGGSKGIAFARTCLLATDGQFTRYAASGNVTLAFEFSRNLISCAIQRKDSTGALHVVITTVDSRGRRARPLNRSER